jgi:hypothetical protein
LIRDEDEERFARIELMLDQLQHHRQEFQRISEQLRVETATARLARQSAARASKAARATRARKTTAKPSSRKQPHR